MVLLVLGRRCSLSSSSYLPRTHGRIVSLSISRIRKSTSYREAVVTRSHSGAKYFSGIVPPIVPSFNKDEARLLVSGPDATGIVASFSQLLFTHGCGIVDCASESSEVDDNDENSTHRGRQFFQRIVFDCSRLKVERSLLASDIESTCHMFGMKCHLSWGDKRSRIAIFVSKYDHCLWELLLRHRAGEIQCDIPVIISNHEDLRPVAETFNISYHVFPITTESKAEQEQKQMALLHEHNIDLLVFARYMQVATPVFCDTFYNRIINIHHSFLPAFMGRMPYHQAHERGVKLIGATAHYTTSDLDQGPIIEQDITRVSHRDDIQDLIRKGRTLEKNVLVAAVKSHLEDRIIVRGRKCIVFAE